MAARKKVSAAPAVEPARRPSRAAAAARKAAPARKAAAPAPEPHVEEPEETDPLTDRRRRLLELRDRLATVILTCNENMLPQLAAQYRATLADISALPPSVQGTASMRDQLKERRESRRDTSTAAKRGATASARTSAGGKGGQRRT